MKNRLASYWRTIASGTISTLTGTIVTCLLVPFSLLYSLVQTFRAACYLNYFLTINTLPKPVVSVGNITVGGTGKTPVAAWLATELIHKGYRVALLSRGYGGSLEGKCAIVSNGTEILLSATECGDEPYLLAQNVPGLMVVIGADRYAAGKLAMECLNPDMFLLDDGFQHLPLHRDLNILLLDHTSPFGNGWTLPAGLLREPLPALKRADVIIRTRCEEDDGVSSVAGIPCCNARHELGDAVPLGGGAHISIELLRSKSVIAFAGIAEPERFFHGLRALGVDLLETVTFPDHVRYDEEQRAVLENMLCADNAEMYLTTEKDGVKLKGLSPELAAKVYQLRLNLLCDKPELVLDRIQNLLQN